MGKKLVDAFSSWIDQNITFDKIKKLMLAVLDCADDANAENAASSTGKYHPLSDQGPGGNVRHSILAAEIAKILMRADPFYDDRRNWELTAASALLHDICKYSSDDVSHTHFEHPVLAAQLIHDVGDSLKEEDPIYVSIAFVIAQNIETHMGRWNKSAYYNGELPKPQNDTQKLIHLADLIAANKELPVMIEAMTKAAQEEIDAK